MKNITRIFILSIIIAIVLVSCKQPEPESPYKTNPLTAELVSTVGMPSSDPSTLTGTYYNNSGYYVSSKLLPDSCLYSFSNGTLVISNYINSAVSGVPATGTYTVEGNTVTITYDSKTFAGTLSNGTISFDEDKYTKLEKISDDTITLGSIKPGLYATKTGENSYEAYRFTSSKEAFRYEMANGVAGKVDASSVTLHAPGALEFKNPNKLYSFCYVGDYLVWGTTWYTKIAD